MPQDELTSDRCQGVGPVVLARFSVARLVLSEHAPTSWQGGKARAEPSVPRHVGLMFHGIKPDASEYRHTKKLEHVSTGRDACDARASPLNRHLLRARVLTRRGMMSWTTQGSFFKAACSAGLRAVNSPAVCPCGEPPLEDSRRLWPATPVHRRTRNQRKRPKEKTCTANQYNVLDGT